MGYLLYQKTKSTRIKDTKEKRTMAQPSNEIQPKQKKNLCSVVPTTTKLVKIDQTKDEEGSMHW